ncbi:hypothetical protein CASFOL_037484 [Castilleja foliolosa]|uniref:C2 domain-containing protein n=1 Tax=Castilleja foliolosa TaxID=1961234 RepID=A0ABD3BML6_9LAMI
MEKPSSRSIEVNVISAEGLLMSKNKPVKKNAFVVVRSDPFNSGSTGMDKEGGCYPVWNEKLVMELPSNARFITVEAHSGNRLIGTANIPVTDFAGGNLPENYLSLLSYRLRDGNGEKNGIVNISVKVRGRAVAAGSGGCAAGVSFSGWRPCGGAPVVDGKFSDQFHRGVVTGIPVSYSH